ncbi:hypothetical protein IHQ71_28875 (plasmid) [Rhizobium sp. TH2]|uniref:hypothetical protein n=1 Tax=Rhizobium sp. TH2 TaxID=2775403 RepID=UPI002157A33A|nr:hypothetical protein [Rhizobium sp. TH2]UVC12251.1 hypothetical protein IHQ71_28875 [Rhizobium sp. TH2]
MNENIVYLHGQPKPVGHFLRVGTSGHRQLETLLGSGRMMVDRVVVEASAATRQQDLLTALAEIGGELILDTNVAELSSIGRFGGAAKAAPWANPESVLTPDDLRPNANRDVIGQIARFAVKQGFHAVQAPAHVLESSTDQLFALDCEAAASLRRALDAEGGKHIGIDYPLMIKNASLRDPAQRRSFIASLKNVPFENLWFRVSGFGADATPAGLRRYIAAMMDFHRLETPIVADGVGGLVGVAIAAFGAAGGICHGVAEKERFDASDWAKPPQSGGGGREKRVLMSGLDRLLSVKQVDALMAAQGARSLLACHDRSCCPNGLSDTLKNPKAHYLRQRARQIGELSSVPEARRSQHFLEKELAAAERIARSAAKLEVSDEGLSAVLQRSSERLEKMHAVLESLNGTIAGQPRAPIPPRRQGRRASVASHGR